MRSAADPHRVPRDRLGWRAAPQRPPSCVLASLARRLLRDRLGWARTHVQVLLTLKYWLGWDRVDSSLRSTMKKKMAIRRRTAVAPSPSTL